MTIAKQLNITKFPFIIKDDKGNVIYYEDSKGHWYKCQYDDKGNQIYLEYLDGFWYKYQYDEKGNQIYFEDSDGYWIKRQCDDKGNLLYFEDSDGKIIDKRPKQVELTMDEIASKFGIPVKDLKIKK